MNKKEIKNQKPSLLKRFITPNGVNNINKRPAINTNIQNYNKYNANRIHILPINSISNTDDLNAKEQEYSNLESQIDMIIKENYELKILLNNERTEKLLMTSSYEVMENSINQGTILLDNLKKQNENLTLKINELEKINQQLNYELIELKQRNKNSAEKKNSQEKNDKSNDQIDKYEVEISKLTLDKKLLLNKLENIEKDKDNELQMFLNYKNSELNTYQNIINDYKDKLESSNLYYNNYLMKLQSINENNNSNENTANIKLIELVESLKSDIISKDQLIQNLNIQIINSKVDSENKISNLQMKLDKVLFEKNVLIKQTNGYKDIFSEFQNNLDNFSKIFEKRQIKFNETISIYRNKITEYKKKIILLKKRINELIGTENEIQKNNRISQLNNKYNYSVFNFKNNEPMIKESITNNKKIFRGSNKINNINDEVKNPFTMAAPENNEDLKQQESLQNYKNFLEKLDSQL